MFVDICLSMFSMGVGFVIGVFVVLRSTTTTVLMYKTKMRRIQYDLALIMPYIRHLHGAVGKQVEVSAVFTRCLCIAERMEARLAALSGYSCKRNNDIGEE